MLFYLTVRLRAGEKRAILRAARKAGVGNTDWARPILLDAARPGASPGKK